MINSIRGALSNFDITFRSVTSVGLNDVIDIAIVAVVIYFIFIWIKETRAWALLKGFMILLAVSLLAYFLNLTTVNWIIANTFNVGLVALVVIFQPELRNALERIGRGHFLDSIKHNSGGPLSEAALDEIIEAVMEMSKSKTGALIVISEKIPLGDLEVTGVQIDARVSRQLIMNIFNYGAPLHDGALIVRGDRISAASCILPLSSGNVDQELGTRHRAALGATEISDAYAIVVSEETGSVSVAHGSKIHRKLSEKQVKRLILPNTRDEDTGEKHVIVRLSGDLKKLREDIRNRLKPKD
ncbi:MAG: diadenylate cyclase CdaA [Defluviitaleaceae bacterium]|nr:diadenylate cyclase CdaA [Defluviitaleaceae bacterium]